MAFSRTTYKRILKRGKVGDKIDVSREELADFRRRYGANLTLRDLLNYDRTGKLPEAKAAPKPAAKPKSASQSAGERFAAYERAARTMPEGTSSAAREALMKSRDEARSAYERAAEAERAGRPVVKTGAKSAAERVGETTPASRAGAAERRAMEAVAKQRAERAEQRRREDLMRPGRDAIEPMLGPEAGLALAGRQALSSAGRGLMSAMERRAASEGAKRTAKEEARKEPEFDLLPQGRVFRSNRPPKDDIPTLRDAVEYKKGGTTKAYAKGGSVKGGGCETRSKKTRYI